MKDSSEVIQEFNEIVNMTSSDLEKWLKSGDSKSAGWPKEDESGESVGHDSGRKIVEILKSNPNKDPEKYTEDQIQHMRKVVSYCKRHLAQEEKVNNEKPVEEVKQTKSYASLKNWGHDPLKKREQDDDDNEAADEEEKKEDEQVDDQDDEQDEQAESRNEAAGDKRKKSSDEQSGANKKRETRQSKSSQASNGDKEKGDQGQNGHTDGHGKDDGKGENGDGTDGDNDEEKDSGDQPEKGPKPGDTVSWNWGNGQPKGKVLDVKGEKTSVTTKRGNQVSRDGDPEDPAVVLDTGKSKAIKLNHELN